MNKLFWQGKKVLITGHAGFKGSWLGLWLGLLGANVIGYGRRPEAQSNLFTQAHVNKEVQGHFGDLGQYDELLAFLQKSKPDIVFHLAAQPLVRYSYENPVETFQSNVMGTVHLLEAIRHTDSVQVIVNVTSDKCYENSGTSAAPFVEGDSMGGSDPYSASKGCAELVATAYRRSYFQDGSKRLASARAGNVIGGGDWAEDRLIPDLIRAATEKAPITIRNPQAVRPWQHVLDCLDGYLLLAEALWSKGTDFAEGWNFGPGQDAIVSVEQIINMANRSLRLPVEVNSPLIPQPYEAQVLVLDSKKANERLQWKTKLTVEKAIEWTMDWYNQYNDHENMREVTIRQILDYQGLGRS